MKAQKWILAKGFTGYPTDENIKLVEFELPELKEGEVLLQAVYLSVDPYMRLFPNDEGNPMIGEQLSEVIATRNGEYPLGTLVLANAGWQSHYISDGKTIKLEPIRFDIGRTPLSYTLGALGMPGATAYLSFEKCNPKPNEIVLVTAAAGAVGSLVGQLAKIKGCEVIGIVGSEEKVKLCKELGFDHVINYKTQTYSEELKKLAPEGVDIYYDNVGGEYYHNIISNHMKKLGRVLVCGSIQTYNEVEQKLYPATNVAILMKELTVQGFMCFTWYEQWPTAFVELNKYIQEGKIKVKESVYTGFENMFKAFNGLFHGENLGKAIVKAVNEKTNYPQ